MNKFTTALKSIVLMSSVVAATATYADTGLAKSIPDSQSITINATVIAACLMETSKDTVELGNYNPLSEGADLSDEVDISLTCTKGITPNLAITSGNGLSQGKSVLKSGSDELEYILSYGENGTLENVQTFTATGNDTADEFTLKISVPSKQNVPTGEYSDTLTVAVTF